MQGRNLDAIDPAGSAIANEAYRQDHQFHVHLVTDSQLSGVSIVALPTIGWSQSGECPTHEAAKLLAIQI
jgi:hypothetical protein